MSLSRNERLIAGIRRSIASTPTIRQIIRSQGEKKFEITGASLEGRAAVIATLQEELRQRLAVVVPNDASLEETGAALRLFGRDPRCIATYPTPSLSPYQEVPPSLAVTRGEILGLGLLSEGTLDVIVIPARALLRRVPPLAEFSDRVIDLRVGEELSTRDVLEQLVENGFVRSDLVGETGEFAFRGGILDLFPPNSEQPVRVELFGDTIDSIRFFEPETQRSADSIESFRVYPMAHFALTKANRAAVARRLSVDFNDPMFKRDLAAKIDAINEQGAFSGIENYVPLAVKSVPLFDYLRGEGWSVILSEPGEIENSIEKYQAILRAEYEEAVAKGKAVYAPEEFLVPPDDISAFLSSATIATSSLHVRGRDFEELRFRAPSTQRYVNRLGEFTSDVVQAHNEGKRQVLFISTRGGREKVERLLKEFGVPFAEEGEEVGSELTLTNGALPIGFDVQDAQLAIYSEWDLFDPPTNTNVRSRRKSVEAFMTDLRDLKVGDFIVHVDHGIGVFKGLQRIPFGATDREVMEIAYGDGGKLLLPMESLNLIQKYSGGAEVPPKLDRLGGTAWARTKASVKKAMRDMADELLKLYATRQMVQGHAFSMDTPWQRDFEDAFEFDETDDQLAAIEDVKSDMESRKPMDRLLCGDVGYGKTEVAMRAAFKSVMDGKQVAMLAPTTILAYQHYRTFLRRFASFPVTVELMSRHWSPKEQKEIARKISAGEIDVLVGTHRLLSKDIQFKDLGVLIIDEEQRFGVAQKERLKQFKKAVDVLAMSATPIPRTLHMSLVGIRDISVIETPPKDRLAIQTAVVPFKDDLVKEAIEFELARGGQVFFVHNRVESIYAQKEYLERIIPGLRVIIGHGQMDERELEKAMLAFIERKYDVLLSTTIIENGIDIPACNTILINHAERFGLSQLYQLRGRVGRSDRLAFCYLLVPSERVLTSDARKRLAAIQEFSDLGAGFRIAARDLEIRGSGNLLGGEQSGQIAAVGFEMYCKLLEETVRELKGEAPEEDIETAMNLSLDIYIPHDYVADENLRMMFYKRIASVKEDEKLAEIRSEMRDRFGAIPDNVDRLFDFVRLKLLAKKIGVLSIVREGSLVAMKFHQKAKIDPNKLLSLLNENPAAKFTPSGILTLPYRDEQKPLLHRIEDLLTNISVAA